MLLCSFSESAELNYCALVGALSKEHTYFTNITPYNINKLFINFGLI